MELHFETEATSRCSYCGARIDKTNGFYLRPGVRLCSRECLSYFMEQEIDPMA